ncbi:gliding motility lipoprotein GldB [Neptunitalea chrysea]|uniref:Gliding motility lipoprotein GldB n=1 Tax=Neptunitalea chrysea TaxID=1647581 RepID=A0A9W6B5L2_9FLAO|nr:gliding motility lipoprotein GldB [Neptunitalea chrysea]GLB51148.1 gliding motility lipoprotein GldB [Neptunitalea chrysea]
MKKIAFLLAIVITLLSCDKSSKIEREIGEIPVEVSVKRFDLAYKNTTPFELQDLKKEYPYMFHEAYADSVWVGKMLDTLERELFNEVYKAYPDFKEEKEELKKFFQHVKYYYPDTSIPEVVTVTSDVDYENQVIYSDKYLFICLDTYLGANHKFYSGIQQYLSQSFTKDYIIVDVASSFAISKVPAPQNRAFLSYIIYYGKKLYLESLLIPEKTDAQRLKYTTDEYAWAEANEDMIWKYFMEEEVLFSTKSKLLERFVFPAPFSKFYRPIDNESPGRLGVYIGSKIVASYMKNNDVSLQQMLTTSAQEIFNNAHYKPRK